MRKILAIIFCFISPYIQAQGRFDDYMAKTPAFSITLSLAKRVKQDVPYSHITFLDVRPDTMALGFYSLYSDSFARYTFKNGFINELEKYFSNNFRLSEKAEDSPALLIAIKKFWISGYTSDSSHFIKKDRKKSLVLDAEVYKENNSGFTAFFRMDTIIEYKSDLLAATAADVCSFSLRTFLEKIISMRSRVNNPKRNFSIAEIKDHLFSRFSIPLLTDTLKKAGVYYTFPDFKNNNPVVQDFVPREADASDDIFVFNDKGEETLVRHFWGLCDGKNLYINFRNNIFPVIRSGNSFYISGNPEIISAASDN